MRIINPSVERFTPPQKPVELMKHIERCGRVCYKSEGKMTEESYTGFLSKIIERGHEAVLEHGNIVFVGLASDVADLCDSCLTIQRISGVPQYLRFTTGYVSGNVRAWRDFLALRHYRNHDSAIKHVVLAMQKYGALFADLIDPAEYNDSTASRCRFFSASSPNRSYNDVNDVLMHHCETLKFTVDRGVSHELVRHRPASFCQESTRYCNYSSDAFDNEITVIEPSFFVGENGNNFSAYGTWEIACRDAERAYFELITNGRTPQEARSVLPNSLKTEVVMTATAGEWLHFLRLRTSPAAHPQMREVALQAKDLLCEAIPRMSEWIDDARVGIR